MSKSVLILEESSVIQGLIASSLQESTLAVHQEQKTGQFLAKAKQINPDLILISNSDHANNYATCRQIRKLQALQKTPVILLAKLKDALDSGTLEKAGINGYVRIPFESATLQEKIKHYLPSAFLMPSATAFHQTQSFEDPQLVMEEEIRLFDEEMLGMIKVLLEKGNAYETADGVYFDVSTFPQYGALSGNTLEKLSAGARVDINEQKRHPADFALWKKCVGPNAHHALRWPSPWGEGFPGWHIECSAMSKKFLGDTIDLHTGGEDNIFPHHECEIAQSECVTGVPFVRVFLHKRRIDMGAAKMSKSLGNILTLSDIVDKGYDAMDLRYYLLSVHYRTNLKFSWKGMDDAKKARGKVVEWMKEVTSYELRVTGSKDDQKKAIERFGAAMDADLNTPAALAAVFSFMNHEHAHGPLECRAFVTLVRGTFGCFDAPTASALPETVQKLVDARAEARKTKDFAASDRLRGEIAALGYEIRDTDGGQNVRKL